jgi:hypothetical protein
MQPRYTNVLVILLTLVCVQLTSDKFLRRSSAQANCQSLEAQLKDLTAQKAQAQAALSTRDCAGTTKPECIKEVTDLTTQIAAVQKQIAAAKCTPPLRPGP